MVSEKANCNHYICYSNKHKLKYALKLYYIIVVCKFIY